MHLTPREIDKLLVFVAAEVARRRRDRGVKLNYPEAMALISAEILEGARDGQSVAELMRYGKQILGRQDVMEGSDSLFIRDWETDRARRAAHHETAAAPHYAR